MSITVAINHKTTYKFDRLVSLSPHVFRLRPAVHSRTPIKAYSLRIEPEEHFINWQQDPFGNILARVVFPEKTKQLSVEVEVIADMTTINPFDFFVESYAEHFPFEYEAATKKELEPYFEIQTTNKPKKNKFLNKWLKKANKDNVLLKQWLNDFDQSKRQINDFLVEVNQQVYKDITYTTYE